MMHRHLITAIGSGLDHYKGDQGAFSALLGIPSLGADLAQDMFNRLNSSPPALRSYGEAGTAQLPVIVVRLLSRSVEQRPLGHTAGGEESAITRQRARIDIMTRSEDYTDTLSSLVMRILQTSRSDFLRSGYVLFQIDQQEELAPVEELAAEELGAFMRRISVSAMLQEDALRAGNFDPVVGSLSLALAPSGRVSPTRI